MSAVERISYKTVSKAELGLAQSHMTHIGFAENAFDDWKKRISIKTNLNIFFGKNYRSEILTLLINDPIKHPKHGFRSPKFRSGSDSELSSLRDSIVYYYKLNMRDDYHTPIFILFNLRDNKNIFEAYLISSEHNFDKSLMKKLSTNLTVRNNSGEIYSKLITPTNNYGLDFKILSEYFAQIKKSGKIFELVENDLTSEGDFDPSKLEPDSPRKTSSAKQRTGQQNFRIKILAAYKHKCCISDCDLIEAMEANHIDPYIGRDSNHVQNGVPLRKDLHQLWTRGLLGITKEYKVVLHDKVKNSEHYKGYEGKKMKLPTNNSYYPNTTALERHCKINQLKKS